MTLWHTNMRTFKRGVLARRELLNLYGGSNDRFSASVSQKRLELKSLNGHTKAEQLGHRIPELLSLHRSLKAL